MICPCCGKTLATMRTRRGGEYESRDLKCVSCGYLASSLTVLLERPQGDPKGTTAHTLMNWARAGHFAEIRRRAQERLAKPKKDP